MRDALRIALEQTIPAVPRSAEGVRIYDPELDGVGSVIFDACELLASSGGVRFIVSGFADEPWPVDVETDLSVVLEQLPAAISALRDGEDFEIDFYEQGIERQLLFGVRDEATVVVTCSSRHPTWSPVLDTIVMSRSDLEQMLVDLATAFVDMLHAASPELATHALLRPWRRAIGVV